MKQIFFLLVITLLIISCDTDSKGTNAKQDRIQKVIRRNDKGFIVRTFDGFIYRVFDSLGRQIEWYGNYKNEESNSNIHNFVEYNDSLIVAREYVLDDSNAECKIVDSLDCFISKYYYENQRLNKREYYNPIKGKNGNIVGHKLTSTDNSPKINPFIHSLPSYLQ